MLEARAEYPGDASTDRAKDRVSLYVDLECKAVDQRNCEARPHDRRRFSTRSAYTLQISLASNAPKPGQHHLLAPDAEHVLLIDEAAGVARLLDARLEFHHAALTRPSRVCRPVVPRRTARHSRFPNECNRPLDVSEIGRGIEVVLAYVVAEADSELLLAAPESTAGAVDALAGSRVEQIRAHLDRYRRSSPKGDLWSQGVSVRLETAEHGGRIGRAPGAGTHGRA